MPGGTVVCVDAYLSDCVGRLLGDRLFGFKCIMPPPLEPNEVEADVVVNTHSHADYFDYDAVPVLARNPNIHFVAAPDSRVESKRLGMLEDRYTIIHEGKTWPLVMRASPASLRTTVSWRPRHQG